MYARANYIARMCMWPLPINAQHGCWSLLLSLTPPTTLAAASTWLRMPSDAESVVVRHYFKLRPPVQRHPTIPAKVARELRISVVAAAEVVVAAASRGLTSDALASSGEMARRLAAANSFARSLTVGNEAPDPTTAPPFFSLEPNTIGPPMRWAREAQGMGAADIAYGAGRFLLRPGARRCSSEGSYRAAASQTSCCGTASCRLSTTEMPAMPTTRLTPPRCP